MAQKNNSGNGGGNHSLKASKQQQQNLQQPQIIASTSTIIPLNSGQGVVGQVSQQQLIGGMGPEVGTLVTANP